MQVSVATPADYAEIAALNVAAYAEFRPVCGEEAWTRMRVTLEAVGELASEAELLVVRDGGRLLGSVAYLRAGRTAPPLPREWASVRLLSVAPEARGRGVGAALVHACIARARAEGADVLGLYTTGMMDTARALYARLGFVQDAVLPPRHGQPCWRYRLDLAAPAPPSGPAAEAGHGR
jgi:GNAT superfamily N-acetyltransferase